MWATSHADDPGVKIAAASPGESYAQGGGTSDATAYTSAVAALLRSKFPHVTAGQIANGLVETAGLSVDKQGANLPVPRTMGTDLFILCAR